MSGYLISLSLDIKASLNGRSDRSSPRYDQRITPLLSMTKVLGLAILPSNTPKLSMTLWSASDNRGKGSPSFDAISRLLFGWSTLIARTSAPWDLNLS